MREREEDEEKRAGEKKGVLRRRMRRRRGRKRRGRRMRQIYESNLFGGGGRQSKFQLSENRKVGSNFITSKSLSTE